MKKINSAVPGFYKLSMSKRQQYIADLYTLSGEEIRTLKKLGYFTSSQADSFIENVVGSYQLPMGIACNFKVNGKDYLVPMATEEPSVVAAASNAARIARKNGGFESEKVRSIMISQIQLTGLKKISETKKIIARSKKEILEKANCHDPLLIQLGGGALDMEIREITAGKERMLIIHLLVDVLDAMGANVVNTMAEAVSPYIEEISGGKVNLRIVSNLAVHRKAKSRTVFDRELLGGKEIVQGIVNAWEFAMADPFRAATHNKGIMNGIIALTTATGNDTRAVEAGAHAYASLSGKYLPLTKYKIDSKGNLAGEIELPLPLGIIGGITSIHPMARLALKILNVKTSEELCQVTAAVGLAQNAAALRALAGEGIQRGHMKLHSRNIAKQAGVPDKFLEKVCSQMMEDKKIRVDHAKEILKRINRTDEIDG